MRHFAALVATGLFAVSCSPEGEVTGSTNKCATDLYPSYNPKALDQCVDVHQMQPRRYDHLLNVMQLERSALR
jgi:hypothetical protein